MRRFVASPDAIAAGEVILTGREAHHAAVVLRLSPGERVAIVDGSGLERIVELTHVAPAGVRGRIVETRAGVRRGVELVLVQGVPKGAKMDGVVRMGTELGVGEFVPVLTRRTVAEGRSRAHRWRRIAAEAAKQSRRADVPVVWEPLALTEALERLPPMDLLLLLAEGERARTIAAALRAAGRSAWPWWWVRRGGSTTLRCA